VATRAQGFIVKRTVVNNYVVGDNNTIITTAWDVIASPAQIAARSRPRPFARPPHAQARVESNW
jgi:hypothetical protein